jgi:hypothetical protein
MKTGLLRKNIRNFKRRLRIATELLRVDQFRESQSVTRKDLPSGPSAENTADIKEAVSTLHRESWMTSVGEKGVARQLNANERVSLNALIAYLAHHSGETEFRIERRLSDRFNVPNMTCLPSAQFEDAIRYLVDAIPSPVK